MTKKRRKLKSATVTVSSNTGNSVHDRRPADLPYNAKGVYAIVPDPYEDCVVTKELAERTKPGKDGNLRPASAATEWRADRHSRITVFISTRNDPVRAMWGRGNITDLHMAASSRYRNDIERSVIGGARGIDYGRTKVDGGFIGDPLGGNVLAAHDRLARADSALTRTVGSAGVALCRAVLGEGRSVAEYAKSIGRGTKHGQAVATDFFRSCLDILAEVYGLATRRVA